MYRLLVAPLIVFGLASVSLGDLTYQVVPRTLDNGYEVTGGTITTDGTLGPLADFNILSWNIVVTGPVGYTFSDSGGGFITIPFGSTVTATAMELSVPPTSNNLIFVNFDDTAPACSACSQFLNFGTSSDSLGDSYFVFYGHEDSDDSIPFVEAILRVDTSAPLVVAAIPEPSAFAFLAVAGLAVGSVAWLNKRRR